MRSEYNFKNGIRGKYASRFAEGTNLVALEEGLARDFAGSHAVSSALKAYDHLATEWLTEAIHKGEVAPRNPRFSKRFQRLFGRRQSFAGSGESGPRIRRTKLKNRLRTLDRQDRLILILWYYEEMPVKDIAAALNTTQDSVKRAHRDILEKLVIDTSGE